MVERPRGNTVNLEQEFMYDVCEVVVGVGGWLST